MTSGARFGGTSRSCANGFVRTAALFRSGRAMKPVHGLEFGAKGKSRTQPRAALTLSQCVRSLPFPIAVPPRSVIFGGLAAFLRHTARTASTGDLTGPWCSTAKSLRLSLPLGTTRHKPGRPSYRARLKVRSVFVEVRFEHLFILKGQLTY